MRFDGVCAEYDISDRWSPRTDPAIYFSKGLSQAWVVQRTHGNILICGWSSYESYISTSGQLEREWALGKPSEFYASHCFDLAPRRKKLESGIKLLPAIVVGLATFLYAGDAIMGKYRETFTPVEIKPIVQEQANPYRFSSGHNITIPIEITNTSRDKGRRVEIKSYRIREFKVEDERNIPGSYHSLDLLEVDKERVLWNGGDTAEITLKSEAKDFTNSSADIPIQKYMVEVEIEPKSCKFCSEQRHTLSRTYEIWKQIFVSLDTTTGCDDSAQCSISGKIYFGESYESGVKVRVTLGKDNPIEYGGLMSNFGESMEYYGEPVSIVVWTVRRSISEFSRIDFKILLKTVNSTRYSMSQWEERINELEKNTRVFKISERTEG